MDKFCCIVIIIIVVICLFSSSKEAQKKAEEEKRRKESIDNQRKREIEGITNQFITQERQFNHTITDFFANDYGSYKTTYDTLNNIIKGMTNTNELLKSKGGDEVTDRTSTINSYTVIANEFLQFGKGVCNIPSSMMMSKTRYGVINKSYWEAIRDMNRYEVDNIVKRCNGFLNSKNFTLISKIDIKLVLKLIWFYATEKPYSAEKFQNAVSVFSKLAEERHVDIDIAEIYAINQMGGADALGDKINNIIKSDTYSSEKLTHIASALMWMNAYKPEQTVLQYMLSSGKQMSSKTQERLHSLSNGGGKAPIGFNVSSNKDSTMYFDVSALSWDEDDYIGFFENLAFKEKSLTYALAVRDENKELFLTGGINAVKTDVTLKKIKAVFNEEYADVATVTREHCVALSGSGEEKIDGLLIKSKECPQMSILVHIARIGKKLNIKFYTLFIPNNRGVTEQKQQVLSLYNKLSPSVAMWESSLKDSTLMAIQQLLNEDSNQAATDDNTVANSETPIF